MGFIPKGKNEGLRALSSVNLLLISQLTNQLNGANLVLSH